MRPVDSGALASLRLKHRVTLSRFAYAGRHAASRLQGASTATDSRLQFPATCHARGRVRARRFLLRFEFSLPDEDLREAVQQLPYVVLLQLGALALAGVLSLHLALRRARRDQGLHLRGGLSGALARGAAPRPSGALRRWRVPALRSSSSDWILAFVCVLGLRVASAALVRAARSAGPATAQAGRPQAPRSSSAPGEPGCTRLARSPAAGDMSLRSGLRRRRPAKLGPSIHGVPVLGSTEDLPRLVKELEYQVVITIAQISRREILRSSTSAEDPGRRPHHPRPLRAAPGQGQRDRASATSRSRTCSAASRSTLDEAQLGQFLAGKRVLVTGAGGSIGSELAARSRASSPRKLLLVERAENALFEIHRELRATLPRRSSSSPASPTSATSARMRALFERSTGRRSCFHAAAHKHVPMMECEPRRGDQEQRLRHPARSPTLAARASASSASS